MSIGKTAAGQRNRLLFPAFYLNLPCMFTFVSVLLNKNRILFHVSCIHNKTNVYNNVIVKIKKFDRVILLELKPDYNSNDDQVDKRPKVLDFTASWGPNLGPPLISYDTMISRDLQGGPLIRPLLPREALASRKVIERSSKRES